jgi:hypothetical protein
MIWKYKKILKKIQKLKKYNSHLIFNHVQRIIIYKILAINKF